MVLNLIFLIFLVCFVLYIYLQVQSIVEVENNKRPVLVYPGSKIPVENPDHASFAVVAMWSEVYD